MRVSLVLGPSTEAAVKEVPGLHVKETHLLILKLLLEGQRQVELYSGMKHHFSLCSLYLYLASGGGRTSH